MREADFIVVGGGVAGCVLAERLSADRTTRVLLTEAGGKPNSPFVGIPAGFAKLFRSSLDWDFATVPQGGAFGRSIYIPRGRMLGGSSGLNAQIHQWCHPRDFAGWPRGWSFEAVAPVLAALEAVEGASGTRGASGPWAIKRNGDAHPGAEAFVAAARATVSAPTPHYNGGPYEGAWIAEITQKSGRRCSAYDAFLAPAMGRDNLEVMTQAVADRVLLSEGRAVGVEIVRGGERIALRARRGVILAAGAIGSPAILMRSGIGPGAHLQSHGIEVASDRPGVGADLQDHPMAVATFATDRKDTLKAAESPANLLRYLLARRGPLASNAAEAVAFGRSSEDLDAPDMELIFAPLEWWNEALSPPRVHAYSIGAIVAAPKSRGSVRLTGARHDAKPAIDFGLFSDRDGHDRRVLLAALRWARKVANTAPLAAHLVREISAFAGTDQDEDLFRGACAEVQTVYHPVGTCRMGEDQDSVVTPELAVRGVSGLLVADASVMPAVPRGHPSAVVAMIAARAAAQIAGRRTAAAAQDVREAAMA